MTTARYTRCRTIKQPSSMLCGFAARAALATLSVLSAIAVHAAEPYTLHDNFSVAAVDRAKWLTGERQRIVRGGTLQMSQRDIGNQYDNTSRRLSLFETRFDEPLRITQVRSSIVVNAADITACPANPIDLEGIGAGFIGHFFSVGPGVPGSMVNDMRVSLIFSRGPGEPPGELSVHGDLEICSNADCTQSIGAGGANLGTVAIGQSTSFEIIWDPAGERFLFRLGAGATQSVPYFGRTVSAPWVPMKALVTGTSLANCFSGPATQGQIEARFDNVQVNLSGTP